MLVERQVKARPRQPLTVRVAIWSARHRWLVTALWFLFTLSLFAASRALGGIQTESITGNRPGYTPKLEANKGPQLFSDNGTSGAEENLILVLSHPTLKVTGPAYRETVARIIETMRGLTYQANGQPRPVFARITDPYQEPPERGFIAPDLSTLRIDAVLEGTGQEVRPKLDAFKPVLRQIQAGSGAYTILPIDNILANDEVGELINQDLDSSLKLTLPLTFLILLIAFGAVAASVVPLVMAVTALLGAFGVLGIYSRFQPVSSYATQIIVLIGLAVAVDYSLFMITRYRTERRRGKDKLAAIRTSSSTAGRSVFFSGLTVAISIAGLFLLDDPIFHSMAVGTIAVVLIAIAGSLTFLPATLAILGNGVNWGRLPYLGRERPEGSGFWSGLAHRVMRYPVLFLAVSAAIMLAIAYPVTNLRLGETDVTTFPAKLEIVQALKLMQEKWPQGSQLYLNVYATQADRPETQAALQQFQAAALEVKGLGHPTSIIYSANGKIGQVYMVMSGLQNDPQNHAIVTKVRQELVPAYFGKLSGVQVYVGGNAAYDMDSTKIYTDAMPLVFGFVLGLSFLLLMVVFHSIVIPVKALLMNLLSTGAAYGVLVLVFQDGWFKDELNFTPTSVIQNWVPVFIFTILFGLSMDYHLFILTRIKEAKDHHLDTNAAVERGISLTAGTITSAAAIMVMVFAVFMSMQMVIVKQLGLGQAVAVLLDVTLVRSLLVPATMRLLGDWNWYMPPFLRWLPRLTIEVEEEETGSEPASRPLTPAR